MKWFNKHPDRIDPDELTRKADQSILETRAKQPHVNRLTSYLDKRKNQNGFGDDWEITWQPRGAS